MQELQKQGIFTERLLLRHWQESDFEPFARVNQDPQVTEFMHGPLTHKESANRIATYQKHIEMHGWGRWAVTLLGGAEFIGWIGLCPIVFALPQLGPSLIEVGWRLLPQFWGKGYATEGAKASLKYGFEILKLPQIAALTVDANIRSKRVLEKIGFHHSPEDVFEKQLLYRITCKEWQSVNVLV